MTTFLTKFTVEFPVADGLLFPYLTGGGGIGRVTDRFMLVIELIPWIPLDDLLRSTGRASGSADAATLHFSNFGTYDALDTAQVTARASYRF